MVERLSTKRVVGSGIGDPSSENRWQSHIGLRVVRLAAMYSASIDDNATVGCFFDLQEIGPPFTMNV